jgi:hypothetical protein
VARQRHLVLVDADAGRHRELLHLQSDDARHEHRRVTATARVRWERRWCATTTPAATSRAS